MSTHGVVAVGNLKSWKGVVCYWDGYPEGLGQDLWNTLADRLDLVQDSQITSELRKFGREVLKVGRWETFVERPGEPGEVRERWIVTSDHPEPLGMEWVYIINPEKQVIHVLAHLPCEWTAPPKGLEMSLESGVLKNGPVKLRNGCWHYGHMILKHYHLIDIDLNAQTANMGAIQAEANKNYKRLAPRTGKIFGYRKPKTHKSTQNGRTFEISDADFERLGKTKTGRARVTDLRTGEVRVAQVTRWRVG